MHKICPSTNEQENKDLACGHASCSECRRTCRRETSGLRPAEQS
ncbi:hypothetical protein KZO69_03955 [Prevotella denticola]|nr:hypothetical protein [Prevotella denticola]MBW4714021.1 hypothetical protein [Prevotella denticola]MBW4751723.1 hypothetical protein [Prevotella denticola]